MECGKIGTMISKLVSRPQIDQALSSSQMEQNVEVPASTRDSGIQPKQVWHKYKNLQRMGKRMKLDKQ